MTIETRPGSVELVFQEDGTVNGSITRHVFEDGVFLKTIGPSPLSGTEDSRFLEFKEAFVASVLDQRDELAAQVAEITTAKDVAEASLQTAQSRIAELEAQLDELLHPPFNPRHVAPYVFLSRFRPEEIYAIQTSVDPTVVVGRAELQTIISYVDLDLQKTRDLVAYLEESGVIAPGRSAALLADYSPE